jgi:hypothetical protein
MRLRFAGLWTGRAEEERARWQERRRWLLQCASARRQRSTTRAAQTDRARRKRAGPQRNSARGELPTCNRSGTLDRPWYRASSQPWSRNLASCARSSPAPPHSFATQEQDRPSRQAQEERRSDTRSGLCGKTPPAKCTRIPIVVRKSSYRERPLIARFSV